MIFDDFGINLMCTFGAHQKPVRVDPVYPGGRALLVCSNPKCRLLLAYDPPTQPPLVRAPHL